MNRRQIALKLVLNELGMPPSIQTFDDRLILQKTVYLIQQLGVPLGYSYSWYIRGPYSRDLTADAFAESGSDLPDGWFLDERQKSTLAAAKPFIDTIKSQPDAARELEKLASVLFVIKTRQANPDDTDSITSRMTAAGKDFSREEVNDAVRVLRSQKFLPQAQDSRR
jgi:uncharacterized protein YwgA